ncbi:MAG: YCF48-related protein, partial [Acidobacteria bacterium]|nr:YCF48-related protein [Acidobacteriota bacterium]
MNYLKNIIKIKSFPSIFLITLLLSGMIMGTFSLSLHAQTYANLWYNGDITSTKEIVIRDAVWAGSRFVAVGDDGYLYLSSDGADWSKKGLMIGESDHLFGVGYNDSETVVAVGRDQLILCSEDRGSSWTKVHDRVDGAADLFKVTFGNGKFVAIDELGGIWTSTDGKTGWAKYNTGWSTRCIAFGNGFFMTGCAGAGAIYRSETGEHGSWSNVGSLGEAVRGIAYGNSKWLAVGRNIATAGANGTGWTTRIKLVDDYNIMDQLYCCATAPGAFIAAGEHGLMLNSSDGITWRNGNSGTKRFILGMAYSSGPDVLVGVGNGGPRDPDEIYLYSSHYSPKGGTPPPILTPGGGGGGSITVVSPNGGEQWLVGTKQTIQWTSSNYTGNVTIDYSYDGRKTWNRLTTSYPNRGSINWTIPATVSNSCFVKVYAVTGSPADSSNSSFAIVRSGGSGTITVTYPNGGERWIVGQKYTITWTSTGGVGLVNVDYSIDGMETWYRLTSNYTNTGSLTWKKIADTPSTNCYVRVWDTSGSPTDNSNASFTIARSGNAGTITVTSPNGGERWDAGADRDITWTSKNVTGNVKLKYSTDNGGAWTSITDSTANDGRYTWNIPEAPSTQCKVQVTSVSDSSATDNSNAVFTILSGRPPKFDVNRHRFNFGYIIGSATPTSAQTMTIANTGGKTLNWAISGDQTWIKTDKTSGTGDDIVQISVDPTGLTAGDYNGTLALSDPAAQNSPDLITVNLKVKTSANNQAPFGEMATPLDGATVYGSIPITGWVLDDVEVQDVKLYYNEGTYFGQAVFVEGKCVAVDGGRNRGGQVLPGRH